MLETGGFRAQPMSRAMQLNSDILITTTDTLPDHEISQMLGLCYGTCVRSRSFVGNALGGFRALFGGRQPGYSQMVSDSREEALMEMIDRARGMGANAIIGVRFDSGEFGSGGQQSMNEVVAYGTAIKLHTRSGGPHI